MAQRKGRKRNKKVYGTIKRSEIRRRMIFVLRYIENGGNGSEAARYAGYMPKGAHVTASRLLDVPEIQEAITAERDRLMERLQISGERVLQEYARIAFINPKDILTSDAKGKVVLRGTIEEMSAADAAAIAEIIPTKDGTRVKLYNKREALADLGRTVKLGLFKDTMDHRFPDLPPDQMRQRLMALIKAGIAQEKSAAKKQKVG